MTPKEIKNESTRVLKGKEIEKVDQKVEKDMIKLTILEAAENIKKFRKGTKTWKDEDQESPGGRWMTAPQ
jgi:histidinol dehydrogenase